MLGPSAQTEFFFGFISLLDSYIMITIAKALN